MAGPGEAHEHTLLLVFGDHGQTLTGDHGGGAPEEVDSALLALNMGAYHQIRSASELNSFMCAPMHVTTGMTGKLAVGRTHSVRQTLNLLWFRRKSLYAILTTYNLLKGMTVHAQGVA